MQRYEETDNLNHNPETINDTDFHHKSAPLVDMADDLTLQVPNGNNNTSDDYRSILHHYKQKDLVKKRRCCAIIAISIICLAIAVIIIYALRYQIFDSRIDQKCSCDYDYSDVSAVVSSDDETDSSATDTSSMSMHDWSYSNLSDWPVLCQTGRKQSPIDLSDGVVTKISSVRPFSVAGPLYYDMKISKLELSLKENSLIIDLSRTGVIISGGLLPGFRFVTTRIKFHWGNSEFKRGSEHSKDGIYFPLEMQIETVNGRYPSHSIARTKYNGLVIFAFLFQVHTDNDSDRFTNSDLDPIIKAVRQIRDDNSIIKIQGFRMKRLLNSYFDRTSGKSDFYQYEGSLTIPPCDETVTWVVFKEPIIMTSVQLQAFHNLNLKNNYRPTQSINSRTIKSY